MCSTAGHDGDKGPFSLDTGQALHILAHFEQRIIMRIQIDEIKEHGYSAEYLLEPHELHELTILETQRDLHLQAPVQVEVKLIRVGSMVEVTGQFVTSYTTSCGRCLESITRPLSASFELTFTNEPIKVHADEADAEEGVELTADELGLIFFDGKEIDLSEAIEEQVILSLPIQPLCSTGCKGLCPQCGVDLNKAMCSCAPPEIINKFSALKNFKVKTTEEK